MDHDEPLNSTADLEDAEVGDAQVDTTYQKENEEADGEDASLGGSSDGDTSG